MFFIGLTGGWEVRLIHVPDIPNAIVSACYQTVEETATADCFYRGKTEDIAAVVHIALNPEDQEL